MFQIQPTRVETIEPIRKVPNKQADFGIMIASSRDESKANHNKDMAEILVYTDGSGKCGKAGAGAVLLQGNNELRKLKYHLGLLSQHMTFKAEAVGALLGAHLLRDEFNIRSAGIYIDNQAVIQATTIF